MQPVSAMSGFIDTSHMIAAVRAQLQSWVLLWSAVDECTILWQITAVQSVQFHRHIWCVQAQLVVQEIFMWGSSNSNPWALENDSK